MHLKEHYEPIADDPKLKDATIIADENLTLHHHHDAPENLMIDSLEDSQDEIKIEEINGDDAFEFSEPEDMEDFRKEVAKVVETIGENPESSWNYQMSDDAEIIDEEYSQNHEEATLQREEVIQRPEVIESDEMPQNLTFEAPKEVEELPYFEQDASESDEDDKPLKEMLVKTIEVKTRKASERKAPTIHDKHELELNECLKKINNFKCNVVDCNKTFNSRTALGYHLKTHNSERRFVCDQVSRENWDF